MLSQALHDDGEVEIIIWKIKEKRKRDDRSWQAGLKQTNRKWKVYMGSLLCQSSDSDQNNISTQTIIDLISYRSSLISHTSGTHSRPFRFNNFYFLELHCRMLI